MRNAWFVFALVGVASMANTVSAQDECVAGPAKRYVPATPANVQKAVFYFPWYPPGSETPECPANPTQENSIWCRCVLRSKEPFPGPRSTLGLYDSTDPNVIRAHMRQIRDRGISVVGIEWGGTHRTPGPHVTAVNTPAVVAVLNEAEFATLKYVILYDSAIALESERPDFGSADSGFPARQKFLADMTDIATTYLNNDPNGRYLRHNGSPVLYVYISRAFVGDLVSAFQQLRAITGDVYLVADELYWSGFSAQRLVEIGANAATSFHGMDPDQIPYRAKPDYSTRPMKAIVDSVVENVYEPRRRDVLASAADVNIHPGIWPQYSDAGVRADGVCPEINRPLDRVLTDELKSIDDWKYMLERIGRDQQWVLERAVVNADCTEEVLPKDDWSVVWAYSFNEWFEGAGIEPTVPRAQTWPFGFGSLLIDEYGGGAVASSSSKPLVGTPLLRGPKGSQETRRPSFYYDGVHNAGSYEIEVQKADGTPALSRTTSATLYIPRPVVGTASLGGDNGLDLAYSTNYEWRVRAVNATGTGPWSGFESFSTPSSAGTESCGDGFCDDAAGETTENCAADCDGGPGSAACLRFGPSPQSFTVSQGTTSVQSSAGAGSVMAGQPATFSANTSAATPGLPILWDTGTGDHIQGSPQSTPTLFLASTICA